MTPLFRSFLELLVTCRAGIAVPAHTLRGWVAQRMGDPRRLPNPLGHAPNGDLQKLFFTTLVLMTCNNFCFSRESTPESPFFFLSPTRQGLRVRRVGQINVTEAP